MLNSQNGRTLRMFKCKCGEQSRFEEGVMLPQLASILAPYPKPSATLLLFRACFIMTLDQKVFFLRVTTDDGEHKFWAAAMPGEEAVQAVLDAIPEGWTVSLLVRAKRDEVEMLAMKPAEVRELTTAHPAITSTVGSLH